MGTGFRPSWPWGVLVGLVLPLLTVPAVILLTKWIEPDMPTGGLLEVLWPMLAAIGVLLTVRPTWLAIIVTVVYAPVLYFSLSFLGLGLGCAWLGSYACP